jgi:hypothetical protein
VGHSLKEGRQEGRKVKEANRVIVINSHKPTARNITGLWKLGLETARLAPLWGRMMREPETFKTQVA